MGWTITPNTASIDENGVAHIPDTPNVTYTVNYTDDKGCSTSSQYTVTGSSCDCSALVLSHGNYSSGLTSASGSSTIGTYTINGECTITNMTIGAYTSSTGSTAINWGTASYSNGTITFSYSANTAATSRDAYIAIKGTINGNTCDQRLMVRQSGASCTCESVYVYFNPVTFLGGSTSATPKRVVTVPNGCTISTLSCPDWVTVTQNGKNVLFSVTENPSTSDTRSGTVQLSLDGSTSCATITVNQEPEHPYVEIGGIKWATMNIGANSTTDAGLYFQWADISGYTAAQVGVNKEFTPATYKYGDTSSASTITKYQGTSSMGADGLRTIDTSDDAAKKHWGYLWRMPTAAEFEALRDATNAEWIESGNLTGLICRDKTDTTGEKYVFFPVGGNAQANTVSHDEDTGYYWSSSLNNSDIRMAYMLYFNQNQQDWKNGDLNRSIGMLIRPIKIN